MRAACASKIDKVSKALRRQNQSMTRARSLGGYLTPPTAHSPTERKKIPPQQNDTKYVENLLTSVEKYTDAFFKSAF